MTMFMPPIQRKKKVEEKYCPDTYRVISEDAVSDHPKYRPLPYRASFEPPTPVPGQHMLNNNATEAAELEFSVPPRTLKNTRVLPQILPDHRANKPQTKSCGFLDRNVRFLNEPICNVYTRPVQHEEKSWWPTRANPGQLIVPPYAEDSNYRTDYNCRQGPRPGGSGRHTAHTEREAALGTVPVNYLREKDGSQRFYKEGVSYEHQYNSRLDPNYPIRGKRHGAFVWSRMDPVSQKKFVEYYQKLDEEEKRLKQEADQNPSSPTVRNQSNNGVFVARSANSSNKSGNGTSRRSSVQKSAKSVNLPTQIEVIPQTTSVLTEVQPCKPLQKEEASTLPEVPEPQPEKLPLPVESETKLELESN